MGSESFSASVRISEAFLALRPPGSRIVAKTVCPLRARVSVNSLPKPVLEPVMRTTCLEFIIIPPCAATVSSVRCRKQSDRVQGSGSCGVLPASENPRVTPTRGAPKFVFRTYVWARQRTAAWPFPAPRSSVRTPASRGTSSSVRRSGLCRARLHTSLPIPQCCRVRAPSAGTGRHWRASDRRVLQTTGRRRHRASPTTGRRSSQRSSRCSRCG